MQQSDLFYSLTQTPFTKSTKLNGLYESRDVKEMNKRLNYLKRSKGVGVFTGNSGTSKTSVLRNFVQGLNPALYKVVYITMTSVSVTEVFRQIARGLGLEPEFRKSDVFHQIQTEITNLMCSKRCLPVIILDEAQCLKLNVFQDLVMLLNFDMDSQDRCILILSGLPSLLGRLKKPVCEALAQRIVINFNAEGLGRDEAKNYIEFVLKECGRDDPIFSEEAIEASYSNCRRSIRTLNKILSMCLIDGAAHEKLLISAETVARACEDIELS